MSSVNNTIVDVQKGAQSDFQYPVPHTPAERPRQKTCPVCRAAHLRPPSKWAPHVQKMPKQFLEEAVCGHQVLRRNRTRHLRTCMKCSKISHKAEISTLKAEISTLKLEKRQLRAQLRDAEAYDLERRGSGTGQSQ
jgi:hypothetical protein